MLTVTHCHPPHYPLRRQRIPAEEEAHHLHHHNDDNEGGEIRRMLAASPSPTTTYHDDDCDDDKWRIRRMTPLHHAASHDCVSLEAMQFLFQRSPAAIRIPCGDKDQLPLHCAILRRSTSVSQSRQDPQQHPYHHYAYAYSTTDHLSSEMNRDKIQFLLEHYPASIRVQDKDGRLPLHLAVLQRLESLSCRSRMMTMMSMLHRRGGDNNYSHHPHHQQSSNSSSSSSFDAIRFLMEQYPQGLQVQDQDGHLPLHLAILHGHGTPSSISSTFDLIQCLVQHYPAGVQTKDKEGRLPLHCAALNHHRHHNADADMHLFQFLVEQFPQAVHTPDTHGRLPLHSLLLLLIDNNEKNHHHEYECVHNIENDCNGSWNAKVQFLVNTWPLALQVLCNPKDHHHEEEHTKGHDPLLLPVLIMAAAAAAAAATAFSHTTHSRCCPTLDTLYLCMQQYPQFIFLQA